MARTYTSPMASKARRSAVGGRSPSAYIEA